MQNNRHEKQRRKFTPLTQNRYDLFEGPEPPPPRQELRTFDMEPYGAMAAGGKEVTIRGVGFATDLKKAGDRRAVPDRRAFGSPWWVMIHRDPP